MSRITVREFSALLAHDDYNVQQAAAVVAGALGLADKAVIDGLVRMAIQGPTSQSVVALEALARIGAPVASNALLPLMKSAAREVRTAAQKVVIVAGQQSVRAARPKRLLGAAKRSLTKLIKS